MKRWPWVVAAVVSFVSVTAGVLWSDGTPLRSAWMIPVATMTIVGTVLTAKVPGNPIGPLCLLFGLGAGATAIVPYSLPFSSEAQAAWAEGIGDMLNTIVVVATVGPILMRFPDGRLPGPRWRHAERATAVAALLGGAVALVNNGWGGALDQAVRESPLRPELGGVADFVVPIFYALLSLLFAAAAVAVAVRFRRADGDEREQLRWLMSAAVILVVAVVAAGLGGASSDTEAVIVGGAMALVPVAIAIAVMRYRLYELDLVISRTLLFGMLVGFITGVYALVVVGLGSRVGGQDNLALSIGSTALVAVLFEPVRTRAQRWANRLVFGRKATPYEVLADLTTRLAAAESYEGLLERMAGRLADGTGAARAAVWVRENGGYRALAAHPPLDTADTYAQRIPGWTAPIEHEGSEVGVLSVETRRGETLTPTERRLTEDLAGSAGLVLNKARLDAALAAKAADLAESRRRLVGAEDLERRHIEQTLEGGVQQQLVSIKLQLGMAAQRALAEQASDVGALLTGMGDDAQAAIDQVRTLARGIFPPLLETEGLRAALIAVIEQVPLETRAVIDDVGRLPRNIEGAVYFTMSEAITNAVKHAAGPLLLRLRRSDGAVAFTVADAGPGFDPSMVSSGSGLANLADRVETAGGELRIEAAPGTPTVIEGRIPLVGMPDSNR
jgi:signal transduction histidine kinase